MTVLKSMLRDEQGVTTVQYALVAVIMTLAVMTGSLALRGSLLDLYEDMVDQASAALTDPADAGPPPENEG